VSLARLSWLLTFLGFLVAAMLLLLSGYVGYAVAFVAVALAASVNLR
jgi:hypothetical protein